MTEICAKIEIEEKSYERNGANVPVISRFHVHMSSSKRWGLMGPSGVGKTTIFRILSGLDKEFKGKIIFERDGRPFQPRIGFVFQERRLFPWLTARQNIELPLQGSSHLQCGTSSVDEIIASCDLLDLADSYPSRLSGGQQARVALARALASNPEVLILDEAMSGLDRPARLQLYALVEREQASRGFLQVLVSHQADEIAAISDQVLLIEKSPVSGFTSVDLRMPGRRNWEANNYYQTVTALEGGQRSK